MSDANQIELDAALLEAVRGKSGAIINEYLLVADPYAMEAELSRRVRIGRLLAAGANPNLRAPNGAHLMWIAGWIESDVAIIQMLVEHGGDPTQALAGCMECREDDTIEAVRYLCEHTRPNLEARLAEGNTVLHEAASRENVAIMEVLLRAGAYVDERNDQARTPLHTAALEGRPRAVRLLVAWGGDVTAKDVDAMTPRQLMETGGAADLEERDELYELLVLWNDQP